MRSWGYAPREMRELYLKTKKLTKAPEPGFAPQQLVTVADALLVDSAAASTTVAVAVLQQRIAGTAGHHNGCSALAPLHAGCHKHGEAARDLFCGRRRQ